MGFGLHQAPGGPVGGEVGQDARRLEGQFMEMHVNRQGSTIGIDTLLQWALEGSVFHAQQGNAITKLAFGETAYDEDQPQFALRIPTGVTVIPLSLRIVFEDQAGLINNAVWSVATNDIGDGTSTSATISSMRVNATAPASLCTANSLYTGNATAATGLFEFARWHDEFAAVSTGPNNEFIWDARKDSNIPILVGPATLQAHITGATALQGFGEYVWAEFPTPDVVRLVGG